MAIDENWFYIEQIKRVLESLGWKVTTTDTTGEKIIITAEREKPEKKAGSK